MSANNGRSPTVAERIKSRQKPTSGATSGATEEPDVAPEPWPEAPGKAAYHGLAGDVVKAIEPETEADPVALLVQFLVAFGSAVGRTGFRQVGRRRHYPNLFAVLVGPTAKARKGTSLDWIESLFTQADPEWANQCIQTGLSSGEGLINAVRDTQKRREKTKAGNTVDVVVDEGVEDKRLLVVEEEFGSTLRVMARDGNILSGILRQAWDGSRLRTLTRGNPLRASEAHISLIGHVTRQELLRCLGQTDQANGFANRILWLAARRSRFLPDGGSNPLGWDALAARLTRKLQVARKAVGMERTSEATHLWHREYRRLTADRPGALGLVASRAEAQVLRLSLLYALVDNEDRISLAHLQAALALWDYCERSCRWVFGESTGSDDADTLREALRQAGNKGMSGREIHAVFSNNRSGAQIREALAVLVEGGQVESLKIASGGPGRPAERWVFRQSRDERNDQHEQMPIESSFKA